MYEVVEAGRKTVSRSFLQATFGSSLSRIFAVPAVRGPIQIYDRGSCHLIRELILRVGCC